MDAVLPGQDLWLRILEKVEGDVKRPHFLTWFQNTAILSYHDGLLVVGVPNIFAKDWLEHKLGSQLMQAIQKVHPQVREVMFEVDPQLALPEDVRSLDVTKLFNGKEKKSRKLPGRQEVRLIEGISSKCLNPKYSLQNFVVGGSSRLAHAAAMAVGQRPGALYNPLFIYGGVGLGKTHLLQAIGNEVLRNDPNKVVVYMTSERFTNEIVEAIGRRNSKEFKDRYRRVDVLIIDDIQFLANKDRTQEEFFHTFNELYDNGKQIIISSDRTPKELDQLEDRLVSRFEMGMIVDVQFPDFETRLAILHSKCREHEVLIHPEVLQFIAMNVHESVRELEGVFVQAIAQAQLEHSTPTVRSVAKIIKKLGRTQLEGLEEEGELRETRSIHLADVLELVASYYRLSTEDMLGDSRKSHVILPRQVAMYLIRNELGAAYEQIGEAFGGKNHTTVMHACEKVEKQLKKDKNLLRDMNAIKKEMGL
ncbi:chromosomal replication initiator protein DnaA [Candidatus Peregrinibacteria bacterium]|nr:MAG: chromosomal replication initiator protein DnaA [Candidatus Peregrinibacteria bacterium]